MADYYRLKEHSLVIICANSGEEAKSLSPYQHSSAFD